MSSLIEGHLYTRLLFTLPRLAEKEKQFSIILHGGLYRYVWNGVNPPLSPRNPSLKNRNPCIEIGQVQLTAVLNNYKHF